jgi:hypothetical protein
MRQIAWVRVGPDMDRARLEELILHELTHCADKPERLDDGRRSSHGDNFNRLMLDVARRLWGSRFDVGPGICGGGYGPSRWLTRERRSMLREQERARFRRAAHEQLRGAA